jgi:hypothetical protein
MESYINTNKSGGDEILQRDIFIKSFGAIYRGKLSCRLRE